MGKKLPETAAFLTAAQRPDSAAIGGLKDVPVNGRERHVKGDGKKLPAMVKGD